MHTSGREEYFSEKYDDDELALRDMSDLESEESAEQRRNQRAEGLKILTPDQMLSKLPNTLTQLKAGNN